MAGGATVPATLGGSKSSSLGFRVWVFRVWRLREQLMGFRVYSVQGL